MAPEMTATNACIYRDGGATRWALAAVIIAVSVLGCTSTKTEPDRPVRQKRQVMRIHYLEVVTPEVDAVCAAYAAASGLQFGDPDPALGNARTAAMPGGGLVGVRAPLRETEAPVVRPYWLVPDIEAAVAAAAAAGAVIAHPPLEIPGRGTFAIYIQGDVEHGLWQRERRAKP
jgi:predicted enzyme related to lactoylglutathione lyase